MVIPPLAAVAFWLICSLLVLGGLSNIKPENRKMTRPKWLRILMIIAGPLTGVAIAALIICQALFIELPVAIRTVLVDSPPQDGSPND